MGVIAHHFSIDVEEYFQVSAFERFVPRAAWARLESRVSGNVERLLDMLARYETRATFFVLGWVATHHRAIVRAIAGAGHEVAARGWTHARVDAQEPPEFRDNVRRTKDTLENLTGTPVVGFRAPGLSITRGREWALDILIEEGYRYDSSLSSIRRPRDPYWLSRPVGHLREVPPATLRWCGVNLPATGGACLRLFPSRLVRTALRQAEQRGAAATICVHPWEIDPEQPRLAVPALARIRHYTGLRSMAAKLEQLLEDFRFTAIADALAATPVGP